MVVHVFIAFVEGNGCSVAVVVVVVVMVVMSSVVGCTTGVEVSPGFVCVSLEEDMVGLMEMKQNVLEGYY